VQSTLSYCSKETTDAQQFNDLRSGPTRNLNDRALSYFLSRLRVLVRKGKQPCERG
jgi:hypothetical protein